MTDTKSCEHTVAQRDRAAQAECVVCLRSDRDTLAAFIKAAWADLIKATDVVEARETVSKAYAYLRDGWAPSCPTCRDTGFVTEEDPQGLKYSAPCPHCV